MSWLGILANSVAEFFYGSETKLVVIGIEREETHTKVEHVNFFDGISTPYMYPLQFGHMAFRDVSYECARFTITARTQDGRVLKGKYDAHYPTWIELFTDNHLSDMEEAHLSALEEACLGGDKAVVVRMRDEQLPFNLPTQAYRQLVMSKD